jgi:hypothetical protein
MISARAALQELKRLEAFARYTDQDFRPMVYVQKFAGVAAGATSAATQQQFSNGAIILGVTANCYVAGAAAATGQSANNRQLFGLGFAFSTGDAIVPGGPVQADILLGSGEDTIFPSRAIPIAPNQSLTATVENLTSSILTVHIAYHCLVYRFAA